MKISYEVIKMQIQLSDHFTYKRLLCFVISPVLMIICGSLYSIVDGFFVSNFVGKTPFAAINLMMPVIMAIGTLGFMIGTGGSAVVSITLGEGNPELANKYFSFLIYVAAGAGIVLSVLGFLFVRPISIFMGGGSRTVRGLYLVRADFVHRADSIYFAECVSKPSDYGGKACTQLESFGCRWPYQCYFRLSLYCCFSLGIGWRGGCYRNGAVCWRRPSAHLLFKTQYQLASADENRFLRENASSNLYKRFL